MCVPNTVVASSNLNELDKGIGVAASTFNTTRQPMHSTFGVCVYTGVQQHWLGILNRTKSTMPVIISVIMKIYYSIKL